VNKLCQFFCCGGKANLVRLTLFYSTLLTLTDRRKTDRETNTLALRGLEELFLSLCCCDSFLFWWEIGFGVTYSRTLLNKLFYELIFVLIVIEVLAMFFVGFLR
jgi:hypothetical protein